MNPHYTYLCLDLCTLLGPLALSFDKKVAYASKWKHFFPGMFITAAFFLIWDVIFTQNGVWEFNKSYLLGIFIGNLPLEEYLFFFIVPFACTFIYECIICYFPFPKSDKQLNQLLFSSGIVLLVAAVFFYSKAYTFWNFFFTGFFILLLFLFFGKKLPFNSKAFWISFGISLVPFLIVNGFLTALPVLIYNNQENLGFRIYTIPFEDVFYGMLLMLMNLTFYEYKRSLSVGKTTTVA